MNEEIREYLSKPNPDFETGFSLFCRYSRNQSLMSWIGRKKDMARLLFELQKLEKLNLQVNPQAAILAARYNTPVSAIGQRVTGPGPQITFKTFDERRTRRADLSPEMQKIYDQITEEYKLRRGYHEKLKMAKTDADRASFRERLLISQNKISEHRAFFNLELLIFLRINHRSDDISRKQVGGKLDSAVFRVDDL